jgi:hypothetical protein
MMSAEKKNKIISSFVTAAVLALVFLFLYFCGLYSQKPPPLPKKMILIEFAVLDGGGGGSSGGYDLPKSAFKNYTESPNIETQIAEEAPLVATNPSSSNSQNDQPLLSEPKQEPGATYRPGKGSGTGSGSGGGSGSGTGTGMGMGSGSGSGGGTGSGKGIGYGSGNRRYTNIPDVNINEAGVVHVEIHVSAQGNVVNARILNTQKYPTTITNAQVLQDCVDRALSAKYEAGKEELRIIIFK